jgi:ankyrin repeat protein
VFDNYRLAKKDKAGKLKFANNDVTPMHIAASLDKIDVLIQFGNLGARYDLLDPRGNTILHTAAKHNAQVMSSFFEHSIAMVYSRQGFHFKDCSCTIFIEKPKQKTFLAYRRAVVN